MFLKHEFHSFSLRKQFKSAYIENFPFSYSTTLCYTSNFSTYFFLPSTGLLPMNTVSFRLPLGIQQIRCILQSALTHRNVLLPNTHSTLFTTSLFLLRYVFDFHIFTCKYISNYIPCYYCLPFSFVITQF